MLWWLSWEQDGDDGRPMEWPPPESVLAFWETGIGAGFVSVVALVRAESTKEAAEAIRRACPMQCSMLCSFP